MRAKTLLDEQRNITGKIVARANTSSGHAQALVRDEGDERGGVELLFGEQHRSDRLHLGGREADHRALALAGGLGHGLDGVCLHPAPGDGLLEHSLQDHEREANAVAPDPSRLEPLAEVRR